MVREPDEEEKISHNVVQNKNSENDNKMSDNETEREM